MIINHKNNIQCVYVYKCMYAYMKSLIPKGAKSTFVTSEKMRFFMRVCTRVYGKLNI